MTFHSILFEWPEQGADDQLEAPACFGDLNLDQVIDAITAGREEYRLKPFFYVPLRSLEAISYRQETFRDLENETLLRCVAAFGQTMHSMRAHLAQADELYYKYQKEAWFVDAVALYVRALTTLQSELTGTEVKSRGLLAFHEYLTNYVQSPEFGALAAETAELKDDLAALTYCLHIQDNRITVSTYQGDADYAVDVEETFQRFKRGAVKDYRVNFPAWPEMNHIEAAILDRLALLYQDVFRTLDSYCDRHRQYLNPMIARFDRELQFFVAYLEYMRPFAAAELSFCYPQVSAQSKEVMARDTFDVALATRLTRERSPVVCNDFYLKSPERIFVVTGPNQGGKTTFARTFGQLHYLASLGCLVPGTAAQMFLFDRLFTHFEREEQVANLRGKLEDDLLRIHEILTAATPRSIVIMNEIFTSTTFRDALFLGRNVLARVVELDLLCVCVTFVDELASLSETTASMVSTVAPGNLAERTFKIVRRPADGRAYAAALVEKYGLSYSSLMGRLAP